MPTQETKSLIRKMYYEEHIPRARIRAKYDISENTLSDVLRDPNRKPYRYLNPTQYPLIHADKRAGMSYREIAAKYNSSRANIVRVIKLYGI